MLTREVLVANRRGLHARAAAKLATLAERFDAMIEVEKDGQAVSAKSIMGMMMLGAGPGTMLQIRVWGEGAQVALEAIVALIEAGFNESD